MKKLKQKALALALALAMVVTALPGVTAFADEVTPNSSSSTEASQTKPAFMVNEGDVYEAKMSFVKKSDGKPPKTGMAERATYTKKDGKEYGTIVFNSKNYTKLVIDGVTYMNENEGGNSTFTVIAKLDTPINVTGTTTAMSEPHDIDYIVTFSSEDIKLVKKGEPEIPAIKVKDGKYLVKTAIVNDKGEAPKKLKVEEWSKYTKNGDEEIATVVLSSQNYTKLTMNGTVYPNENEGGNSTFTIPVKLDTKTEVVGTTTSMGGKDITYFLTFSSEGMKPYTEPEQKPDPVPEESEKYEEGIYVAKNPGAITEGNKMFRCINAELKVDKNGKPVSVDIYLSGTGYEALYVGKVKEGAIDKENSNGLWEKDKIAEKDRIPFQIKKGGEFDGKYFYTVPVEKLDVTMDIGGLSGKYGLWSAKSLKLEKANFIYDKEPVNPQPEKPVNTKPVIKVTEEKATVEASVVKSAKEGMVIELKDNMKVEYSKEAMASIIRQLPSDATGIQVEIKDVTDRSDMNKKQADAVKNAAGTKVFSITLNAVKADGSLVAISNFNGGEASITVDYTKKDATKDVLVYRVEKDGKLTAMETSFKDGKLTWITDGHSYYMVSEKDKAATTKEKTPATPKTGDTEDMALWIVLLLGAAVALPAAKGKFIK